MIKFVSLNRIGIVLTPLVVWRCSHRRGIKWYSNIGCIGVYTLLSRINRKHFGPILSLKDESLRYYLFSLNFPIHSTAINGDGTQQFKKDKKKNTSTRRITSWDVSLRTAAGRVRKRNEPLAGFVYAFTDSNLSQFFCL